MGLPDFGFVTLHKQPLDSGMAAEAQWLESTAAQGRAQAHLWQGAPGWAVPRSYTRAPGWNAWVESGEPVQVRASGGGLVPQGPGLLNLSLVWRAGSATPRDTDAIYRALCSRLQAALARLGMEAATQAVAGSFCDGRFNLAVAGRKCIGTAQAWRRVAGVPMVLAHAVIVLRADLAALCARANAIETALGHDRRYRADAIIGLEQAWCLAQRRAEAPADLEQQLRQAIGEQFAPARPPERRIA